MNIIVSARHTQLSKAMKDSVINNLESLNHTERINKIEVVLDVDHHKHCAEMVTHGVGFTFDTKAESGNMYDSIDKVIRKLQKQINKNFGKALDGSRGEHLGNIESDMQEELID